jgi:hypothetical protein
LNDLPEGECSNPGVLVESGSDTFRVRKSRTIAAGALATDRDVV